MIDIYDWQAMVGEFMETFKQDVNDGAPAIPSAESQELGDRLVDEEWRETRSAMNRGDIVEVADGIGDTIYTLLGLANRYGIDMAPVMAEIHRSNMAKVGGPVINGKLCKPAGWTPPNIARELRLQGWNG